MTYRCNRCDFTHDDRDSEDVRQHAWVNPRHPRCIVCTKSLSEDERLTCDKCIRNTRDDLTLIEEAAAVGETVVAHVGYHGHYGIDLLSHLADGSVESHQHDDDEADAKSILGVVESWARYWRLEFGHQPADEIATVAGCIGYLQTWMTLAGRTFAGFDDFATEIRALRQAVASRAGTGNAPRKADADCFDCGGKLICDYAAPATTYQHRVEDAAKSYRSAVGRRREQQNQARALNKTIRDEHQHQHDQLGDDEPCDCVYDVEGVPADLTITELRTVVSAAARGTDRVGLLYEHDTDEPIWHCGRCKRSYSQAEYRLAVRAKTEDADKFVPVREAADEIGRRDWVIWNWQRTGKITSACSLATRRIMVKLGECKETAARKNQRNSAA